MSATTHPTKFDSVLDLARLSWFTVEGGNRVVLAEGATEEIGPVIDSHTHLAMGFLRRLRIDLPGDPDRCVLPAGDPAGGPGALQQL